MKQNKETLQAKIKAHLEQYWQEAQDDQIIFLLPKTIARDLAALAFEHLGLLNGKAKA